MKKLPDTEFDVMRVIWSNPSPITTPVIMVNRLNEKGFHYSEKKGKMRYYYPLVKKHDYLEFVTNEFIEKYHGGSFTSFFATLFDVRMVSDETLDSFVSWVKQHRREFRRYIPD